ncbi:MAG TPA: FIST C-terminal domain-containing protein, partial [Nitrospirota bacterium]|nr:FIST C-terminal domain-containing protein [Nitrospirota bacterium]
QNAAIAAVVRLESGLGIRHGWVPCAGPFVATRTSHTIIMELNWENAFDVYQRAVAEVSGRKLTRDNFFAVAKAFPFGMLKEGAEDIVRDPIAVNNRGELVCVGEIPENAVLTMLRGDETKLLDAAAKTVGDCLEHAAGKDVQACLLFDCISRALFLRDFPAELRILQAGLPSAMNGKPLEGALTLGEISSHGQKYLEFMNKTVVLGVLFR